MHLTSTSQFGSHDLFLEIARGNVSGASVVHKFGRNSRVDSAAADDIWDAGGTYVFPTTACIVDVESSASADDVASTGARTVQIYGLDADYAPIEETISLDGADMVESTQSYLRLFRMIVRSAGTGEESAGTIVATHRGTASAVAEITQGANQTLMAIYTVPASVTAYMQEWRAGIDRNGTNVNRSGDARLLVRPEGEVFQTKDTFGLFNSIYARTYTPPLKIAAKSDIRVNASAVVNNTAFSAAFDLILLADAINY